MSRIRPELYEALRQWHHALCVRSRIVKARPPFESGPIAEAAVRKLHQADQIEMHACARVMALLNEEDFSD